MSSPYNAQLAPNVGRGLPGLPRKGDALQRAAGQSAPFEMGFRQPDVFYDDVGVDVRFPVTTYRPQNSGARPVRGSLNLGLLRMNRSTGSPPDALIGFRYNEEGIEFGSPLTYNHAEDPKFSEASLSLPDGSFVSAVSATQLVRLKVDPDTLAVTQTPFATLVGKSLATGGSFSLRGSGNFQIQEHQDLSPVPLALTEDGRVLALVGGWHEGQEWAICMEYDLQGSFLNAHRLFTFNQVANAQLRGAIVPVGNHYVVLAYLPSRPASSQYTHLYKFLVSRDFSQVTPRVSGATTGDSTSVVSRAYVTDRFAFTFNLYSDRVNYPRIEEMDDSGQSLREVSVDLYSVAHAVLPSYISRALTEVVVPPGSNLAIPRFSANTYSSSSVYTLAARGVLSSNSSSANDLGWIFNPVRTKGPRLFFEFTSYGLRTGTQAFYKAYPLESGLFLVFTSNSFRLLKRVP